MLADLKRVHVLEDDDADNYKRKVYAGFTLGFALIIAGIVLCVLCTLLGIISCIMAKNKKSGAKNADSQSKADKDSPPTFRESESIGVESL